jgi:1-phosphofructokinase
MEVPGLQIGGHLKARLRSRIAAGKAVNVSRALATLGVPTTATGFLGEADLPYYADSFKDQPVNLDFVLLPVPTRENITLVDPVAGTETHIRDVGFQVTDADVNRLATKVGSMAHDGVLIILSGSCPPGLDATGMGRLIDACLAGGAKVALDTSGPPLAAMRHKPLWLSKPNRTELAEWTARTIDDEASLIDAGKRAAQHHQLVLASSGSAGAHLFTQNRIYHGSAEVDPSKIVNTVGCGDCLLAGFVAGVYRQLDLPDALALGLAVATASAMKTTTASFDMNTVRELQEILTVIPVQDP